MEQSISSWHKSHLFFSALFLKFMPSKSLLTLAENSSLERFSFSLMKFRQKSIYLTGKLLIFLEYQACEYRVLNLSIRIANYSIAHKNNQVMGAKWQGLG